MVPFSGNSQSLDPADGGGEIAAQPHWVSVILFYLVHVFFVIYANSLEQKWRALSTLGARVFAQQKASVLDKIVEVVAAATADLMTKTGGAPTNNNCTFR
jgi:hypothetical protein